MSNPNQKGTKIEGGAVSDEVLESASNLLSAGQADKGLQQFYSPEPLAKFVALMLDKQSCIDLTAGDGSLLSQFPRERRFGVEIDPDQIGNSNGVGIEKGGYYAVQGDLQHVAPLLIEINAQFKVAALNPPFGLKWSDPTINDGRETNSALVTLAYAERLLDRTGAGVLVTGGDGGYDNALADFIPTLPTSDDYYGSRLHVYAVISCPDIWQETRVANDIVLFGFRRGTNEAPAVARFEKSLAELCDPDFIQTLNRLRTEAVRYKSWDTGHDSKIREMWMKAAQQEYDRRRRAGQKLRRMDIDVWANGSKLVVKPRPFVNIKLAESHALQTIKHLHKQPLTYFALNEKRWIDVLTMEEQGTICIDPALKPRVQQIIEDTRLELTPMTALKPQQRLAYLEDVEKIKCTVAHERNGREFVAGEEYPINVRPVKRTWKEKGRAYKTKDGTPDIADFELQKWILEISIEGCRYYEVKDDIEFLVDHFDIPDPGTVDEQYPELIEKADKLLDQIEAEFKTKKRLKPFQRQHLRRLIVKERGLLAHEQGLGKTLQGLVFARAMVLNGADDAVLIIAPQDLIPQWQREAKDWFGIELIHLKRHDAKKSDFTKARDHIEAGGSGWYITHYEALSRVGKKEDTFPMTMRVGHRRKHIDAHSEWVFNPDKGHSENVEHPAQTWYEDITRAEACPRCGTSYRAGYNPNGQCEGRLPNSRIPGDEDAHEYSTICGWTPYSVRVKPAYDIIKNTFRHGIRVIDELTKIKGESQMSLAVRGVSARHTLGMTGTPIKNYAPDAYWGLWSCLGNATARFPFNYKDGQAEFIQQFTTIEWRLDAYGRRQAMKKLPEVSNISNLWKLLAPNVCRLRKEESGEPLVERTFYPTMVPCGANQRRVTELWLMGFADFFKAKYPEHRLVIKGLHEWMAPMLGLQPKLEYAATMPTADPDSDYWVEKGKVEEATNWTPKNARVLELAMHHAAQGDKVLIGSALKAPGRWLHDELNARGVRAINILAKTEDDDDLKTLPPAKRAAIVREFQTGDAQVLVSSHALNLGHNLDKGSVVILTGLPWDYATFDQFIARVHRLTSENAVKVYVVLSKGTIDERKWKLLVDKASAANLALDGRLVEETEEKISESEIIAQMIAAGIPVDGTEVLESELEEAWAKIESADDLPELVLDGTPVTNLADLAEEEDESDEPEVRPGADSEEEAPDGDIESPDGEAEEAGPPEAEAEVGPPFLAVVGNGRLSTLEAYLYGGYNEIQWTQEFSLMNRVMAIIQSDTHAGFGAGPQADRLRSGLYVVSEHASYREAADAIAPTWSTFNEREGRMAEVAAAKAEEEKVADVTSSPEVSPEPETTPEAESEPCAIKWRPEDTGDCWDCGQPQADHEQVEAEPDDSWHTDDDKRWEDETNTALAEPVTVPPDDDYFAGF